MRFLINIIPNQIQFTENIPIPKPILILKLDEFIIARDIFLRDVSKNISKTNQYQRQLCSLVYRLSVRR